MAKREFTPISQAWWTGFIFWCLLTVWTIFAISVTVMFEKSHRMTKPEGTNKFSAFCPMNVSAVETAYGVSGPMEINDAYAGDLLFSFRISLTSSVFLGFFWLVATVNAFVNGWKHNHQICSWITCDQEQHNPTYKDSGIKNRKKATVRVRDENGNLLEETIEKYLQPDWYTQEGMLNAFISGVMDFMIIISYIFAWLGARYMIIPHLYSDTYNLLCNNYQINEPTHIANRFNNGGVAGNSFNFLVAYVVIASFAIFFWMVYKKYLNYGITGNWDSGRFRNAFAGHHNNRHNTMPMRAGIAHDEEMQPLNDMTQTNGAYRIPGTR